MILRIYLALLLPLVALAADHHTFKNCSRVDFCNRLRTRQSTYLYTADLDGVTNNGSSVTVGLNSNDKEYEDLVLILTALSGHKFRLEIQEKESSRYKLEYSLKDDPELANFTSVQVVDGVVKAQLGNALAEIQGSPHLNITFSLNGIVHTFIDGGSLLLENNENSKAFTFKVTYPNAVAIYGLHEHADRLALKNTRTNGDPYRLRNLDVAGYEVESPMSLYGAIPVVYGHGLDITAGAFLHNAAEQWIDISNRSDENVPVSAYFMVKSGSLDLFILNGPAPKDVLSQYVTLTGTHQMPPLWSLGYHQCRWNYMTQEDTKFVIASLDDNDFPVDAIWLDIEYTDGKRYFTWNPVNFSDPLELQANLSSTNRKLVTIIDPHIKVDENYPVYAGAKELNYFVKNADGSDFQGDCWPGLSSYIDFLNPAARDYYSDYYSYDKFNKTTPTLAGIWNDMNEPSVFIDEIEKTLPDNATHFGGVQHVDIHNIYGLLHTISTHEGLLRRDNNSVRPFILTRSHFAGSQRYTAIWTGDNTADWSYLSASYSMCLNANILGISFCGADVGGFFNNPDEELLQRWYQAGAWLPFYREHANMGTKRREPYLYNKTVQSVIRTALKDRYKHIPYWYTLFFEHIYYGNPVLRPLFYQYPDDPNVATIDDHLLVGENILVRPVFKPGVDSVDVYFPGGANELWFSHEKYQVYPGLGYKSIPVDMNAIPVYYRAGSVILRKDIERPSTTAQINDGYSLYAYLNQSGLAQGRLYIDDFNSFNYETEKKYLYLEVMVDAGAHVLFRKIGDSDSSNISFMLISLHIIAAPPFSASNDGHLEYQTLVHQESTDGSPLYKLDFSTKDTIRIN